MSSSILNVDPMSLTTQDILPCDFRMRYGDRCFRLSAYEDVWKYVIPSLGSIKLHLKTSRRKVERVRSDLLWYLESLNRTIEQKQADIVGVEDDWENVCGILRDNAGMTEMMLDHGCQSRFLYKVIQTGAQAILLEVFHGRFISVAGDFEYYPYADPLARYAVNEPIAVDIQERTKFAQAPAFAEPKQTILLVGAGLVPEVRLYNCPSREAGHKILAVDMDERNKANLGLVFGEHGLEEHGVTYVVDDARNVCHNPNCKERFSRVLAQGVMSYYKESRGQAVEMFEAFDQALKPGGILVFGLQLRTKELVRCATSLGWRSKLSPDANLDSALEWVMPILRDNMGYRVKYCYPMYRGKPATALFEAVKPER